MLRYCPVYVTVLCLSLVFVAQLDPTSQIVICFLFAQPLVCKLLSVNQATNYTAAAAEWNHFYLRGHLELRKTVLRVCSWLQLSYLFIMKYPGPVSSLANRHTKTEKVDCPCQKDNVTVLTQTEAFRKFTWHFLWITAVTVLVAEICWWQLRCIK